MTSDYLCVYMLHDVETSLYKIGFSQSLWNRLDSVIIEGVTYAKIVGVMWTPDAREREKHWHSRFSEFRCEHPKWHGGRSEWFRLSGDHVSQFLESCELMTLEHPIPVRYYQMLHEFRQQAILDRLNREFEEVERRWA